MAAIEQPAFGIKEFGLLLDELIQELIAELPTHFEMPALAQRWIEKLIRESLQGGKMNRGMAVVDTFLAIADHQATKDELRKAAVLGWCVEWLQAFFLVADDLMDRSETRRGRPCWYRQIAPLEGYPEQTIELIAANDSLILESHIYRLLKKYFSTTSYYVDLIELFHETTYQTELGQLLDLTSQPRGETVLTELFTMEKYFKIVRYKTAFYSFYLPVALGLYMAGAATPESLKQAYAVLIPMGEYFQVQDDYLDCYGEPAVIGKIGRDIEEKKCGWLVCKAMLKATEAQKELIRTHYGRENRESVAEIKKLYRELDIEAEFRKFEEESYQDLVVKMQAVTSPALLASLKKFLAKIYKRSV